MTGYLQGYMHKQAGLFDSLAGVGRARARNAALEQDRQRALVHQKARHHVRNAKLKEKWLGYPELEEMSWPERLEYAKKNKILGFDPQPVPTGRDKLLQAHEKELPKMLPRGIEPPPHRIKPDIGQLPKPPVPVQPPAPKPPMPPLPTTRQ